MTESLIGSTESLTRDNLVAHDHPLVIIPVTIASGEGALVRGTVLGIVTLTGEYAAYDNAANDGTETAAAVLWDPDGVNATSAAAKGFALVHGGVREDALTGIDAAGIVELQKTGVWVL